MSQLKKGVLKAVHILNGSLIKAGSLLFHNNL